MRVHPSQLKEGCVLLQDVPGKSGRPIMKANTVLTEQHIIVLHKFLIDSVEVSSKLVDGKLFTPKERKYSEQPPIVEESIDTSDKNSISFPVHYVQAVKDYKQFFTDWSNGIPIDISKVRQSILPLLERIDELEMEIFMLHQLGTAEDYIYHHSVAVALLSAYLGKELGYRKGEWIQLGLAGYLSDAGMTKIESSIITGGGPLTGKQLQEVRNHPTFSYRMVENLTGLSTAAKIAILQHHERMDASGYPLGLRKEKITMDARILAVSDTYHAMTSTRLYKEKRSIFKVIDELLQEQFTRLDATIVQQFVKSIMKGALGKTVYLANNKTGEIVFIDDDNPTRPIVKIHESDELISLQMNPELQIEDIILD